jgi:hypothetical protein
MHYQKAILQEVRLVTVISPTQRFLAYCMGGIGPPIQVNQVSIWSGPSRILDAFLKTSIRWR